ncbi:MAG: hypothetical protein KGH49_02740 [Candidatus Micrarchaeota archaeon]|nr:hypothetical protein [Candidatus Micrarchaeota archaeon]
MRTRVQLAKQPSQEGAAIHIYNSANLESRNFLRRISNPYFVDRLAKIIPPAHRLELSGSGIYTHNPYRSPRTDAEVLLSTALLRIGVRVAFEPVYFMMPELGRMYNPDAWTNIYVDRSKMLMMDVHGFERIRRDNAMLYSHRNDANMGYRYRSPATLAKKEEMLVRKMQMMHQNNHDIFFVLVTDLKREEFERRFGISDISKVCDRYMEMPGAFDKQENRFKDMARMSMLKREMKALRRMPGARLERDPSVWHNHIGQKIKQELMKITEFQ